MPDEVSHQRARFFCKGAYINLQLSIQKWPPRWSRMIMSPHTALHGRIDAPSASTKVGCRRYSSFCTRCQNELDSNQPILLNLRERLEPLARAILVVLPALLFIVTFTGSYHVDCVWSRVRYDGTIIQAKSQLAGYGHTRGSTPPQKKMCRSSEGRWAL